jgi:hypothetical protein
MNANVTVVSNVLDAHFSGEDMPEIVYHPETGEEIGRTTYVRTDAWRGYWEVIASDGWVKVGEGANCGSWEDTPTGTSNAEVEAKIEALAEKHGEVIVVLAGTSNVFSVGYDVFARDEAEDEDEADEDTYKIVRYRRDGDNEFVATGLSLEEAQEHCDREDTRGDGWFDGYVKEG